MSPEFEAMIVGVAVALILGAAASKVAPFVSDAADAAEKAAPGRKWPLLTMTLAGMAFGLSLLVGALWALISAGVAAFGIVAR